jgi:hypothetical protein
LTWSASTDSESGISKYIVKSSGQEIDYTASTVLELTHSGLTEGTQYSYTVEAVNLAGLSSGPAGPVAATTQADNTPPSISSVSCTGDPNRVTITFSETMDKASSENPVNYAINNSIQINSAALDSDNKTIILATSAHTTNVTYTLTVNNVKDASKAGNTIANNSTQDYPYIAKLIVTLVDYYGSDTEPSVKVDLFEENRAQVNDRSGAAWTNVPAGLDGLTYLLTARNDRDNTKGENEVFYRVNASAACTVFALVQTGNIPVWVTGDAWTSTPLTLTGSGKNYEVYKKVFAAGNIDLKRQTGPSEGTGYVFKLADSGPTVEINSNWPHFKDMQVAVWPNPFKTSVNIKVRRAAYGVRCNTIHVYTINGELLANLTPYASRLTHHTITWDAGSQPSGVYIAKFTGPQKTVTKKIFLVR